MKAEMIRRSSWGLGDRLFVALVGSMALLLVVVIVVAICDSFANADLKEKFYGHEVSIHGKDEVGIVTGVEKGKLMVYFPKAGMIPLEEDMVRVVKERQKPSN